MTTIEEYYKSQMIKDRDKKCEKYLRDKYFEKDRCMDEHKPIKYYFPYDSEGNVLPTIDIKSTRNTQSLHSEEIHFKQG